MIPQISNIQPNQALEPTTTAVTGCACAHPAPAVVVAHLDRSAPNMTYHEKKLGAWRAYELSDQSIEISGKTFLGSRFRTEFGLDKIKPTPDEVSVKDDAKTAYVGAPGFALFMVGLIFTSVLYAVSPVVYFGVLGIGVVAMLLGFVFGGHVKAYVFRNRDEAVLFDLTERGNSPEKFEEFAAAIRSQAEAASEKAK